MGRTIFQTAVMVGLFSGALLAQDFPMGELGRAYFTPRIDLNPEENGGELMIEIDGELDEEFWGRAAWHEMVRTFNEDAPDETDAQLRFAAAADSEFLYIGWVCPDDFLHNEEEMFCGTWRDDSIEIYIDANNDGPECPDAAGSCYGEDDAQLTIGANNANIEDP